jgi:NADPH:quinone reductase-like Zn-dependent oxidoreductase
MGPGRQQTATGEAALPGPAGSTMRAIVQDGYGSTDVLRLARIAVPEIGGSEVLLRVHAAGLDRGRWHMMTGRPYLLRLVVGLRGPRSPVQGLDVAGTVVAAGPAVTRFSVGDEVFGFGRGTFAEYAAGRQDKLARKPANASFDQAAVIPVSAVTALQALTDAGHVKPGQKVLITGASGGVGSYAVQLAAAFGAEVTGVCSTAKLDLVRSLGAAHVIDYSREDFADGPRRYDLIIDIAGNPAISRLRRALTPTGTATAPQLAWSPSLPTCRPWGESTSTTCRASGPTPAHGPTTSPSWPMSCSPTSWPAGCRPPPSPPMRCIPAWCGHPSEPRIPAVSSDCSPRSCALS